MADPNVLPVMIFATSLVIQRDDGEQIVRMPRATDAIGQSLRSVYGEGAGIPPQWAPLLRDIDRVSRRHH